MIPAVKSKLGKHAGEVLKAVSRSITVYGGAASPRGIDKPGTKRDRHSPTTFIPDLGAAYRASGRTAPISRRSSSPSASRPRAACSSSTQSMSLTPLGGRFRAVAG